MAHARSCISPARALLWVLRGNRPSAALLPPLSHQVTSIRCQSPPQLRHASFMPQQPLEDPQSKKATKDPFPGVIRDGAITARNVQIPMPEGGLGPVESLDAVLSRVKQGAEHLVQLSEADEGGIAICKITSVADLEQRQSDKAMHEKLHQKSFKQSLPKQIELNWAIGPHDLAHKLVQLKTFITDGRKVEVVLASRKRGKQASPDEGRQVLTKIRQKLDEADGREIKPIEGGEVGKRSVLTVRKRGLE